MKKILFVIVFIVIASKVEAQNITPNQGIGFDYSDADFATFAITRFDIKVDANYQSVKIPPKKNDELTPEGHSTYAVSLPAMTPGPHTIAFRACNTSGCSGDSTPINIVLLITPAPKNLRIITITP